MIHVEEVSRSYKSGRGSVQALREVSFEIEAGTAATIVGKSGSGKSTLLRIMGGLERPDRGRVMCNGEDITALGASRLSHFLRSSVGFVFQFGNLLSYMTAAKNIALPLALNGVTRKESRKRVKELLERIGLSDAGSALPHELSGGELQRVAIARAIAHKPRLLLADEPTASLDSATARSLIQTMFDLGRDSQCTIVMTTHDQEILRLADKVLHLRDGRLGPR